MATSRLLPFRTSSFFHIYGKSSAAALSSPPLYSLLAFTHPRAKAVLPRLQFQCGLSSLSEADENSADHVVTPASHPWPEWGTFLERLKSKGYFDRDSVVDKDGEGSVVDAIPTDMNSVKSACLSFARDRFDILKSLSKKDIQSVVECGCPNLLRKAVNSAKRLRAYVKLDEADVCSACNLRGSCDRAYVTTKDNEGARTVDIVRILLSYAVDPLTTSEGDKPHAREYVEISSRKLLSELVELSETTPDPSLQKSGVKFTTKKEQSEKVEEQDKQSQNVEMKRGDWICPKCNFMNFSRNMKCLKCKEDGPKRVSFDEVEMKKGDWSCPQCEFLNFARNTKCLRCQGSRPKRELKPGEWECPSCDFLNYRRNITCLKCNCKRPKDETTQYEDQMWRKPKMSAITSPSNFEDDGARSDDEENNRLEAGKTKSSPRTATKWY